jgi:hypothetical protein
LSISTKGSPPINVRHQIIVHRHDLGRIR